MSYTGPERRTEHCDLHERNTNAIESLLMSQSATNASTKTWRIVGSLAGGIGLIIASSIGWLITDTLTILRSEIKELKVIVEKGSLADVEYKAELRHIEMRVLAIEETPKQKDR